MMIKRQSRGETLCLRNTELNTAETSGRVGGTSHEH